VEALVEELRSRSPEFAALWREQDVRAHGEGTKQLRHPTVGLISMEYSSFAVDGRPELSMVVYQPATRADVDAIRQLLQARQETTR